MRIAARRAAMIMTAALVMKKKISDFNTLSMSLLYCVADIKNSAYIKKKASGGGFSGIQILLRGIP